MENTTEFLDHEKVKIFHMGTKNTELIENLKKFINFLDQVEIATLENILLQLNELNDTKTMSDEMFVVFKNICQNLYNKQE